MAEEESQPLLVVASESEPTYSGVGEDSKENDQLSSDDQKEEEAETGFMQLICCCLQWPWPMIAVLIGVGAYIGYAQWQKSMAIQYYYYYKAKIDVDWSIYSKTESGSSGETYTYNVWEAIRQLWNDESYLLAIFVTLWSGIWPYFKLLVMAIGLVVYRKQRMPARFTWLSGIAHFSFLDVWMVIISAVAARFYYDGSETKTDTDVFKISVKLTVKVYLQGYAMAGVYEFFYALIMSQLSSFFMIKLAQLKVSDLVPSDSNVSEHFKSECFRPICLGWDMAKRIPIPFRREDENSERHSLMWSIFVYTCGTSTLIAMFILLYNAFYEEIMKVYWDFSLDETIDETEYDITYDKTFKLSEVSTQKYTLHGALKELLKTTEGLGETNYDLCYIGIFMGIYLPLIRSALVCALWSLPMPKMLHRLVSFCTELVSLFCGHDTFLIAFFIMGPLKQMQNMFTNSGSDLSDYITFTFTGLKNGLVFLIAMVVFENFFWYSVTTMHDKNILMIGSETVEAVKAEEDTESTKAEEDIEATKAEEDIKATKAEEEIANGEST
eukprot:CAMPEP_0185752740 /NCGR_PEP_ID=MMETSP1174-20130828/11515_1 /TAXON_ID=35687 /ORGANISM="Dictyocha speculum, Strain CCMP1381" /LENGTH=552 /DNA_ID=CAMNT_0028430303 /DNA_START=107 /DNA_END=1765 /DNA_ORIENTATION=-